MNDQVKNYAQCGCECHRGGIKTYKACNPPIPCCDCSPFVAPDMGKLEIRNSEHPASLMERIEKLKKSLEDEIIMRKDLSDYCFERLGSSLSNPWSINDVFMRINELEEENTKNDLETGFNQILIQKDLINRVENLEEMQSIEKQTREDQISIIDERLKDLMKRQDDIIGLFVKGDLHLEDENISILQRIEKLENLTNLQQDFLPRINEISNYECHNRALIDELQKDLPMRIQERIEKIETWKESLDEFYALQHKKSKIILDLIQEIYK